MARSLGTGQEALVDFQQDVLLLSRRAPLVKGPQWPSGETGSQGSRVEAMQCAVACCRWHPANHTGCPGPDSGPCLSASGLDQESCMTLPRMHLCAPCQPLSEALQPSFPHLEQPGHLSGPSQMANTCLCGPFHWGAHSLCPTLSLLMFL